MSARLPRLIGPYSVEAEVGSGGMGVVARARHRLLDRRVAIKIRFRRGGAEEGVLEERFRQGARLQAELDHPHIARVLDYLEAPNFQALVMEFLGGGSMEDRLRARGGALPTDEALAVAIRAADALGYGHERGVMHRDIKPANLMLVDEADAATVRVTDFGVAKAPARSPDLTMAGANVGTLWYMSPEQFNHEPATPRADVYALGATLYELLTGTLPFESAETSQIFRRFLDGVPPPPVRSRNPSVPTAVAAVVEAALSLDPGARPASAGALSLLLRAVAERELMTTEDLRARSLLQRCDRGALQLTVDQLPGAARAVVEDALSALESRVSGGTAVHRVVPTQRTFNAIGPDDVTPSSHDSMSVAEDALLDETTSALGAGFDDDEDQTMVMNLPSGLDDEYE